MPVSTYGAKTRLGKPLGGVVGGGVVGGGVPPLVRLTQLRLNPAASTAMRMTCWPAVSEKLLEVTVVQVCQPPVDGMDIVPVTFAPSISACSEPPPDCDAVRPLSVYVPPVVTLTVYSSHSPAAVQPTSLPAPVSVDASM